MSTIVSCINPNPDIAGIGVRVSVYIQAFLNLASALIFAKDGVVSVYETTILTRTSTSLFITGCALLLSAFIQTGTMGVSVYHALIVLNLSWVNVLSANLYLMIAAFNELLKTHAGGGCAPPVVRDGAPRAKAKTVVYGAAAHLCAMGAFGIVVWSKIDTFGNQEECTPHTFLTVFGRDIPVTRRSLRRASLGLYSIAAIPMANIGVVVGVGTLTGFLFYLLFAFIRKRIPSNTHNGRNRFLLVSGVVITAFLEVLFIVDTELMIVRSSRLVKEGESEWTFGQTLAMVLVIVPLYETGRSAYLSWKEPGCKLWLNLPTHVEADW